MAECSVCFEPYGADGEHRKAVIPCGHIFGMLCIKQWLRQPNPLCPTCSKPCKSTEVIVIYDDETVAFNEKMSKLEEQLAKEKEKVADEQKKVAEEQKKVTKEQKKVAEAQKTVAYLNQALAESNAIVKEQKRAESARLHQKRSQKNEVKSNQRAELEQLRKTTQACKSRESAAQRRCELLEMQNKQLMDELNPECLIVDEVSNRPGPSTVWYPLYPEENEAPYDRQDPDNMEL